MDNEKSTELNENQKIFCREYIFDWNASRAYSIAYPKEKSNDTIRANSSRLLTKANIKAYIKEIQSNLEEVAGISRLRVLKEHEKLAFSSIANLHNTWIELSEFEALTDEQKASIESIETKTIRQVKREFSLESGEFEAVPYDVEYVKIKLYNKQNSLDAISKMLGYNEPEKIQTQQTIEYKNVSKQFPDK